MTDTAGPKSSRAHFRPDRFLSGPFLPPFVCFIFLRSRHVAPLPTGVCPRRTAHNTLRSALVAAAAAADFPWAPRRQYRGRPDGRPARVSHVVFPGRARINKCRQSVVACPARRISPGDDFCRNRLLIIL